MMRACPTSKSHGDHRIRARLPREPLYNCVLRVEIHKRSKKKGTVSKTLTDLNRYHTAYMYTQHPTRLPNEAYLFVQIPQQAALQRNAIPLLQQQQVQRHLSPRTQDTIQGFMV